MFVVLDQDHHQLRQQIELWAKRLKVSPKHIRIQSMTHKWGSCSSTGTITFASDLAKLNVEFQKFVIVHELLHLRIPNHGKLFKALMTAYVPEWRAYDLAQCKWAKSSQ
jgi:predicted metal-dependent hydrolase